MDGKSLRRGCNDVVICHRILLEAGDAEQLIVTVRLSIR